MNMKSFCLYTFIKASSSISYASLPAVPPETSFIQFVYLTERYWENKTLKRVVNQEYTSSFIYSL